MNYLRFNQHTLCISTCVKKDNVTSGDPVAVDATHRSGQRGHRCSSPCSQAQGNAEPCLFPWI